MDLHMHEPQWSGVRRMTHFDRYEVVMSSQIYSCLVPVRFFLRASGEDESRIHEC